jgi:hypothetical protein
MGRAEPSRVGAWLAECGLAKIVNNFAGMTEKAFLDLAMRVRVRCCCSQSPCAVEAPPKGAAASAAALTAPFSGGHDTGSSIIEHASARWGVRPAVGNAARLPRSIPCKSESTPPPPPQRPRLPRLTRTPARWHAAGFPRLWGHGAGLQAPAVLQDQGAAHGAGLVRRARGVHLGPPGRPAGSGDRASARGRQPRRSAGSGGA